MVLFQVGPAALGKQAKHGLFTLFPNKVIALIFKEHVEGGQASIDPGDILL